MATWYSNQVASGELQADPGQAIVIERLQQLSNRLVEATQQSNSGGLLNWFGHPDAPAPRSLYIHGSVGRGKSFLMDGFFLNLPRTDKLRVHFHGFMRHFHRDMHRLKGRKNALVQVANELADRCHLLCFDEIHVSDITDAMVLGRLLKILLGRGVTVVATSNYVPSGLYPNGLARDRFLPTIEMIEDRFDVCSLDGDTDYRLRALSKADIYLTPVNADNETRFARMFDDLANGMTLKPSVRVGGRRLMARLRTSDAVWLEFSEACAGNYGQGDYLQLAERFTTVFLSGVPQLGTEATAEATRRFTWLVDVLYDTRVKLVLLAEPPLRELFTGEGGESGRTLSRLEEMQSQEYLRAEVKLPQSLC